MNQAQLFEQHLNSSLDFLMFFELEEIKAKRRAKRLRMKDNPNEVITHYYTNKQRV